MERKRSHDGKFISTNNESQAELIAFRLPSITQIFRFIFQIMLLLPWIIFLWKLVVYFNVITVAIRILDFTRPSTSGNAGLNGEDSKEVHFGEKVSL